MSSLMIHGGMIMAVVGALLMAATRVLGQQLFTWDRHLLAGGVVLLVLGFFTRGRQSDRRWRVRGDRCTVCGKKVHPGQIYCEEHHKEATRRLQDKHDRGQWG